VSMTMSSSACSSSTVGGHPRGDLTGREAQYRWTRSSSGGLRSLRSPGIAISTGSCGARKPHACKARSGSGGGVTGVQVGSPPPGSHVGFTGDGVVDAGQQSRPSAGRELTADPAVRPSDAEQLLPTYPHRPCAARRAISACPPPVGGVVAVTAQLWCPPWPGPSPHPAPVHNRMPGGCGPAAFVD
jgi:hypothetical protein